MASPTLTLQLSDKTLKKLRALAMLSGSTVDELEKEFADYFDQMLTENIAHLLSEMDGKPVVTQAVGVTEDFDATDGWQIKEPLREASAKEAVATEQDPNSHGLSDDDLPEEVKSTAEQVEEDFEMPQYQAPQAGGNAEAFLDAAMASEKKGAAVDPKMVSIGGMTGRLQAATKGFNPHRPRATVAEFTGDE